MVTCQNGNFPPPCPRLPSTVCILQTEGCQQKNQIKLILHVISQKRLGTIRVQALSTQQANFSCQFFLLPCWKWLDNTPSKCKRCVNGCLPLVWHTSAHTLMPAHGHTRGHARRLRSQSSSTCTGMQLQAEIAARYTLQLTEGLEAFSR